MRLRMQKRTVRSRKTVARRGSVLVEFTLVTPLLVALLLGTMFYGYNYYTYNRLEEAVRAGARFASTQPYNVLGGLDPTPPCAGGTCNGIVINPASSAFARAVRDVTVYGTRTPTEGQAQLIEGLGPANVQVLMDVKNNVPVAVGVAITNYQMNTPMGAITLSKPVTMFPYPANYLYKIPEP